MLEFWRGNRSDCDLEQLSNRFPKKQYPRWSAGYITKRRMKEDTKARVDLNEGLDLTDCIDFGDINTCNGKRQYQPSMRNQCRKNPERNRSWKDKMGSKKRNQHK